MQLIFKKSLLSVQTGGYFIRNESISDGATIVVKGPGVAGVAVGKDLKGSGIRTGKNPAEIIHVVGVAGISVVENPKCRNADILHHDAVEDDVGGSYHICEVRIRDRGHKPSLIAGRHRTHVGRRRCRTRRTMYRPYAGTRSAMTTVARPVVMVWGAAVARAMVIAVGPATVARTMVVAVGPAAVTRTLVAVGLAAVARTLVAVGLAAVARTVVMFLLGFMATFSAVAMVAVGIYVSKS